LDNEATIGKSTASRSTGEDLYRRHLRFGWWALFVFLSLGILLEIFHGLKIDWYMKVSNETRRLMLTLAHAHGALLSLVNIAFALTAQAVIGPHAASGKQVLASQFLKASTLLLPGGFFLGGVVIYGGDPGLGIFLVPIGGLTLLLAVGFFASSLGKQNAGSTGDAEPNQASPAHKPAKKRKKRQ